MTQPTVVRRSTSISIDAALWRSFKIACATAGRTTTEQMERMIRAYLKRKETPTPKRAA